MICEGRGEPVLEGRLQPRWPDEKKSNRSRDDPNPWLRFHRLRRGQGRGHAIISARGKQVCGNLPRYTYRARKDQILKGQVSPEHSPCKKGCHFQLGLLRPLHITFTNAFSIVAGTNCLLRVSIS